LARTASDSRARPARPRLRVDDLPPALRREVRLVESALDAFGLDLRGRRVLTEAASGPFRWTPLAAARAGAERVVAVGGDSRHGAFADVERETRELAERLGVADRLELHGRRRPGLARGCDLVTNLGFVRPLDAPLLEALAPGAAVCLMWEPWELREEDLDLAACRRLGLPVLGTREGDPRLGTFHYVALAAARLLLDHAVEIRGARLLLLGDGPFTGPTRDLLAGWGATVEVRGARERGPLAARSYDAALCLEHRDREALLLAPDGAVGDAHSDVDIAWVIHVCGALDPDYVRRRGFGLVPDRPAPPGWMSFNTAHAGPRPVIDLHVAGLRVGQAALQGDRAVLDALALPVR